MTRSNRSIVLRLGLLLLIGVLTFLSQPHFARGVDATVPPTNTPRVTLLPNATNTRVAPPTRTPLPTRTSTDTRTPTLTRTPTNTRTPTLTRTPSKTPTLPPTMVILGTYETPVKPLLTAIPPAMPTPKPSGDDMLTVMLLGSDTITPGVASRTDVIILLSIDRTTQTVAMMHIPRDAYIYEPNSPDGMVKINTVMNDGETRYGSGGGVKLMKDTIFYNFGLKVDFYAHVNFTNFEGLIAKLGGLDLSVDCAIQGHRLKSPELDYTKEENYELYTLPIGYQHLSPYMALWYVRSRGSSSDIDRGRRQMEVLRAMWQQAKAAGIFTELTTLWPEAQKLVETDMTLTDVVGLTPFALSLDPAQIQRIDLSLNHDFMVATIGAYVLLPNRDAIGSAIQDFVMPPPPNRLGGESPTVEVAAALPVKGFDKVAADRLAWEGFTAKAIGMEGVVMRDATVIYDYTGNSKPASLQSMVKLLRVKNSAVIQKPDPNRLVDFRVEMGRDYGTSCFYALPADAQTLTPQPAK